MVFIDGCTLLWIRCEEVRPCLYEMIDGVVETVLHECIIEKAFFPISLAVLFDTESCSLCNTTKC